MSSIHGSRRVAPAALSIALALLLAACATEQYPNSTFDTHTEFGRAIDRLWDSLLFWGTIVFLIVEGLLLFVVIRYRHREGNPEPKHVHGNTTLEILWTAIPALILVFIAVPTVRTIFETQAKAKADALQVEVVGHQWWWEFRYPQYTMRSPTGRLDTLVTANELYIPTGRTVNFALRTADVLHSFWAPRLGGKRDLISNHVNYLWFTADSLLTDSVFNGNCTEYCGASHANMKFRAYPVSPAEFESWARHQLTPARRLAAAPGGAPGGAAAGAVAPGGAPAPGTVQAMAPAAPTRGTGMPGPGARPVPAPDAPRDTNPATLVDNPAGQAPVVTAGFSFPPERMPRYAVPQTPMPEDLRFDDALVGDAARGEQIYSRSACIGCHVIRGNPMSVGIIGPNLTHVGTRNTIAGGLFPNDARHMARWLKNSRKAKPGVLMPTLGRGEYDPIMKNTVTAGALDDQQIADIVAYLQTLK